MTPFKPRRAAAYAATAIVLALAAQGCNKASNAAAANNSAAASNVAEDSGSAAGTDQGAGGGQGYASGAGTAASSGGGGVQSAATSSVPPPPLPNYQHPPMPETNDIWTPGYWGASQGDYYWVPGTWVQPPSVGLLWTPPYWGFVNGVYAFNAGYWGPTVGFYGGVNYGFGYGGLGYQGGRWQGRDFYYNTAVNNLGSVRTTNVYRQTVETVTTSRVSYNGGRGGLGVRPTPAEIAASRAAHAGPSLAQQRHEQQAGTAPAQRAKVNGGHPPVVTTARPATLGSAAVARPAEPVRAPATRAVEARPADVRPAPTRPERRVAPAPERARPAEAAPAPPAAAPRPKPAPEERKPEAG